VTEGGRVVIGVGNALRGDDGAGLAVVERLAGRVPAGVALVPCEREPSRLVDAFADAAAAVVVDAVSSSGRVGEVHRFDASDGPLPVRVFRSSTHAFGVGEAVELARALGRLPGRVVVYGVEGAEFAAGAGLTPEVERAVERVAAAVLAELDEA
jgi:hydrogenase maturation protease